MYTAELVSIRKELGGNATVIVRLIDDIGTAEELSISGNDLTMKSISDLAQRAITAREIRDITVNTLILGPITLPRDTKEGQDDAAAAALRDAFFEKLALYNSLLAQVDKGIIKSDDAALATAASDMKAAFLPEYASDVRFR